MTHDNLFGAPPPTHLPEDPAVAETDRGTDAEAVARSYPSSSFAWAVLAEGALAGGRDVEAYAYARTGYHRGLDALRRSGWKGHGPVPWEHCPNQGFLRALAALAIAADHIGDDEEAQRCAGFLQDSSAAAYAELLGDPT